MIALRDHYDVLVARDCSWELIKKLYSFSVTKGIFGSSNGKEMLMLDNRMSLEEDEDLLLRCLVPFWKWILFI